MLLKFKYSEKATKFCETSTLDLSYLCSNGQIYNGDFAKFCGLYIWTLTSDAIETGRSMGSDYWAAHVGGAKM